jgi:distribution and morphology protein 12
MSIDLNWEAVTGGPDGQELAGQIRDFIHTKFQSVPLPRFIKSVTVHDFQFGTIPPEIELKDITDPLPDFYEDHVDSDLASDSDGEEDEASSQVLNARRRRQEEPGVLAGGSRNADFLPPHLTLGGPGGGSSRNGDIGLPFMRVSTPGIPGGTANLHYFHSPLASGLSGTQTPLAAVASAHHLNTAHWLEGHGHSSSVPNLHNYAAAKFGNFDAQARQQQTGGHSESTSHSRNPSQSSISIADFNPGSNLAPPPPSTSSAVLGIPSLREKHSVSTLAPTSAGTSRPPTRDAAATLMGGGSAVDGDDDDDPAETTGPAAAATTAQQDTSQNDEPRLRERRLEDMQAVFRIRYAGDVRLLLTADILLDYPMPSFVGIPVRLSITGLTFDGVGVLAKIRKRVHFCFLSPEDAVAAVGGDGDGQNDGDVEGGRGGQQQQQKREQTGGGGGGSGSSSSTKLGGLLQEIRVESEIGQRESGKQSLKNVGKVERFVLEQVRRIFEEEFVYPSFWTFLV